MTDHELEKLAQEKYPISPFSSGSGQTIDVSILVIGAFKAGYKAAQSLAVMEVKEMDSNITFTKDEFREILGKFGLLVTESQNIEIMEDVDQFISMLPNNIKVPEYELFCRLDQQQCQESCEHKGHRKDCPFITKKLKN